MRTVHPLQTTSNQHPHMASVPTPEPQITTTEEPSSSGTPPQSNLNLLVTSSSFSLDMSFKSDPIQVSNNQPSPQASSSNILSPSLPSIASPDPNASLQSILATSKSVPPPTNGQIPPWNVSVPPVILPAHRDVGQSVIMAQASIIL
jgi:hypothetical protein